MTDTQPSDWNEALPATLPEPSYWPAALALGNTLLLWGLLTTWIISAAGGLLCVGGLSRWIGSMLREHRNEEVAG
jgi:hypothetical protein